MRSFLHSVICSVLLANLALAAPAVDASAAASAAEPVETVALASDDPNYVEWNTSMTDIDPEPIRGALGAPIIAQTNIPMQLQNPDLVAPPTTDAGLMWVYCAM